jgi:peptide/nickel transport system permease protein
VFATLMAVTAAVLLAVLASRAPDGIADRIGNMLTSASLAVPAFVGGPIFAYLLAVKFRIFPVSGWTPITQDFFTNLRYAFLPSLCIALGEFAILQRLLRAELIATLREPFIDVARARGTPEWRILLVHALKPSSIPAVTVLGLAIGRLLGGTVIVETLFSLPGLGQTLVNSILARDLVTTQGIVVVIAVGFVVVNLVVDLMYTVIDPRIRVRGEG